MRTVVYEENGGEMEVFYDAGLGGYCQWLAACALARGEH